MKIYLAKPDRRYKQSYLSALKEYFSENFLNEKLNYYEIENDFDTYIKKIENWENGVDLPDSFSPQSERWLVKGNEYFGTLKIRHKLCNETLKRVGGHIGYFIRPSRRKMGYGNLILSLGLVEAKKIGLEKVLIICDESNIGSKNIIVNNGGVFESSVECPPYENKLRFWIDL